jgi:hypothetical protein
MTQQVGGILIDTVGARTLEFILAISARKQSYSKRPGAAGGQKVPHTVSHHNRVTDRDPQTFGGDEEEVGSTEIGSVWPDSNLVFTIAYLVV